MDVLKIIWDGEIYKIWSDIDRSTFNKLYKNIKITGTETYLLNNIHKEKKRKIWSRIRWRTINKAGKLNKCWFCKVEYEALTHLMTCEYIKSAHSDDWLNWMEEKKETIKEEKAWAAEFTNGMDLKWCNFCYWCIRVGSDEEGKKILRRRSEILMFKQILITNKPKPPRGKAKVS